MPDHTRSEMRVWIGFAASFSIAFLVTFLASDKMTNSQTVVLFTIAASIGFINHGISYRERGMVVGGFLSTAATLISLAFVPLYFTAGWIILGCAMALTGFYRQSRMYGLAGVYVTLGGVMMQLSANLSVDPLSVYMVWNVLVGLMFIAIGMETKGPVMHLFGASWIVVAVVSYVFYPELMFLSMAIVFAVGMTANSLYLYRLLGRTPRIGEIFSFATRALFLHGLTKPIDQYRVIAILIKGNIGAEDIIRDLMSRLEPRSAPILLLGPTSPTQLTFSSKVKIGWVTTVSGVSELEYPVLSPENPTTISVFLNKTLKTLPKNKKPVILGDFLDNMIPHMNESLFYKYYSDLASNARISNYTVVFVVKADIHSEADINVVKRFADVIIENREREEKGRLIREVRVTNLVDNINTNWKKYSIS